MPSLLFTIRYYNASSDGYLLERRLGEISCRTRERGEYYRKASYSSKEHQDHENRAGYESQFRSDADCKSYRTHSRCGLEKSLNKGYAVSEAYHYRTRKEERDVHHEDRSCIPDDTGIDPSSEELGIFSRRFHTQLVKGPETP